jgi:dipeptide transport system substrate-binding protein
VKREPVKRKKVRQALALALDPALVGPALGPAEDFARAFLPAGFWGAVDGSFYPALNLSRARALLAEERLGEGALLTLIAERAPGGPDPAPVAEALRIAWAAAGIQLRLQIESPEIFRAALRAGEYDVALTEVKVPVLDPHFLFAPLVSQNGSRDPRVADLVLRAGQVSFRPERLRLYQRLQALLAEELLWLPLSHQLQWVLVRPEVRDFRLRPSGTAPLHAVGVQP